MTFADLTAEMLKRGAENDATRNGLWINLGYREVLNRYEWSFSVFTATGTPGTGVVSVPSIRKVYVVGDVNGMAAGAVPGRKLFGITFEELTEDPLIQTEDVTITGTPEFWWYDAASTSIKAFPVGGTIYVRGIARLDELTGVQVPVFDEEYHLLIVDRAMVEVLMDRGEYEEAARLLQHFERRLLLMAQDYQVNAREHSYVQADPFDG